jgi:hypothetical protein
MFLEWLTLRELQRSTICFLEGHTTHLLQGISCERLQNKLSKAWSRCRYCLLLTVD